MTAALTNSRGGGEPLPPIGTPPSIELIPIARLAVDMSYQRGLSAVASVRLIAEIRRQLDWRLFLPLVVSRRADGRMFVIDGQHRMEGAKARGDILYAPCTVIDGLTQAEEAELFCRLNGRRKPITKVDLWRSAIMSGDEQALLVADIIAKARLVVVESSRDRLRPGQINTIGPIMTAIKAYGPAIVEDALGAVARAFRSVPIMAPGMFLSSACAMIKQGVTAEEVETSFARKRPLQWLEMARVDPVYLKGATGQVLALRRVIDRGKAIRVAPTPTPISPDVAEPVTPEQARSVAAGPSETRTFEQTLAMIERGELHVVDKVSLRRADPSGTLGGVASAAL